MQLWHNQTCPIWVKLISYPLLYLVFMPFSQTRLYVAFINSWICKSFYSCVLGWKCVHNSFVRKEQAKKTEYLLDFSVDAPENRDSPTSSSHAVSCKDEISPGGYFAFLLAVEGISVLRAFLVLVPDKGIYLSLAVLSIHFFEEKKNKSGETKLRSTKNPNNQTTKRRVKNNNAPRPHFVWSLTTVQKIILVDFKISS